MENSGNANNSNKNNSNSQMGGRRRGTKRAARRGRGTRRNQMGGQNMKPNMASQMGGQNMKPNMPAPQMGGGRGKKTRKNNMMGGANHKKMMYGGANHKKMMYGGARQSVGSHVQVWHGTADHTSGGLKKKDLMKNKHGRIISKKKHALGKKALKNLVKAGFKAKKGTFKLFRK
jgi:hypothetical protein